MSVTPGRRLAPPPLPATRLSKIVWRCDGPLNDQRGGVSSAYFAGLYVFLACPAIGVGLIAARTTLITAGVILCVLVIALAIVIAAFEFRAAD